MSNVDKKITNFAKSVLALMKGETDEAKALKIERKCLSYHEGQISSLKASLIDKEDAVQDCEEKLTAAIFPVEIPSNPNTYIGGIKDAQEAYDNAIGELTSTKESIAYFETIIKEKF